MPPENPHQQRPQRGHGVRQAEYLGPALQQSRHFSGTTNFMSFLFSCKSSEFLKGGRIREESLIYFQNPFYGREEEYLIIRYDIIPEVVCAVHIWLSIQLFNLSQ